MKDTVNRMINKSFCGGMRARSSFLKRPPEHWNGWGLCRCQQRKAWKRSLPISTQKRNGSLLNIKPQEPKPRNTRPSSKMWMRCWPLQRNRNNSGGMNWSRKKQECEFICFYCHIYIWWMLSDFYDILYIAIKRKSSRILSEKDKPQREVKLWKGRKELK